MAAILDDGGTRDDSDEAAVAGRAGSRSTRPVAVVPAAAQGAQYAAGGLGAPRRRGRAGPAAGGMGQRGSDLSGDERVRRVLVHASGFRQSPYADIKPQGVDAADTRGQAGAEKDRTKEKKDAPSKLWHSSPGSSGW